MSTHLLLAIALIGPPDEFRDAPVVGISAAPWTGEQLQEMFRDQTRRTARIRDSVPRFLRFSHGSDFCRCVGATS